MIQSIPQTILLSKPHPWGKNLGRAVCKSLIFSYNNDANDYFDIVYDHQPFQEPQFDNTSQVSQATQDGQHDDIIVEPTATTPTEPVDTLQAVIQDSTATNPSLSTQQRDPKAKDGIHAEINEDNIIPTEHDDTRPGTQRYNMRPKVDPKKPRDFTSKFGFAFYQLSKTEEIKPRFPVDLTRKFGFVFTQMSAREGLKRFGERASNALIAEWIQLDHLQVFKGVLFASVTPEQRKRALRLVHLIKEKRCGKIKGRTCADGRKQRD